MKTLLILLASAAICSGQNLISVATTPPTPPQQVASLIITGANSSLITQVAQYKAWYDAFWNNPNQAQADPISNAAALGTNAVKIFAASAENVRHFIVIAQIAGVDISTILPVKYQGPPAGWVITPNSDGTVTLRPPLARRK